MKRREMLYWGGILGLASIFKSFPVHENNPVSEVDHLIWGTPDLEEGIRIIKEKTGVKAVFGGVHPGGGTCNALISLGNRCYLEILAPDPKQPGSKDQFAQYHKILSRPKLLGWGANTRDIAAVKKEFQKAGIDSQGPTAGSRKKPDGSVLKWRSLVAGSDEDFIIPFVIQWDRDSTHPGKDSPKGCLLRDIHLVHPDPARVNSFFKAYKLKIRVKKGPVQKITAGIDTPKGRITLTS